MPYLFSYGSNSPRQLSERLGRPVTGERASVADYRRVFRGHSQRWGGGVASLERSAQDRVYGYVERVSDAELNALDRFEGVGLGKYKRIKVPAQMGSQRRDAVAYVSTSTTFTQPTRAYLEAVAETIGAFWTGSSGKAVSWKDIRVNPEEIAMRKMNPAFGVKQPDLFGGDSAGTRTHVPISSLTEEQLKSIPRDDYGDDEWEELDPDIQEYIHEHDPASVARVEKVTKPIIEQFKYYEEPDDDLMDQWIDSEREHFEGWLGDHDEPIDNRDIREEVKELVEEIVEVIARERTPEEGAPEADEIRGAINNALREADNYNFEITGNEYQREFYKSKVSSQQIYFGGDDFVEMVKGLHPDELERAAKEINRETYLNLKAADLEPRYYGSGMYHGSGIAREFAIDIEPNFYFEATPDWDKIKAAALEELGWDEPRQAREAAAPPEARVVYRFPDGWYVQDLLSSELPEETKRMGNICVGKPQFGYVGAVKAGDAKIYSLRNKGGKPFLTFEAGLVGGKVVSIRQIKGAGNRFPGWTINKQGKGGYAAMNVDEVKRAVEFVQSLGIDPASVHDLDAARDAVLTYSVSSAPETPDSQFLLNAFLGAEKNPGRRRNPSDRPLGFNSPWTP